jgi:hypothetical protein
MGVGKSEAPSLVMTEVVKDLEDVAKEAERAAKSLKLMLGF